MIKIKPVINYDHDILIVGAGPGGAAMAAYLAKNGIDVLLIDSSEFPRDKVCGDFVGPVAIAELQNLGIAGLDEFPKTNLINQASVFLDGNEIINRPIPKVEGIPYYGRVIPRIILDKWIVDKAIENGATLSENTRLTDFSITDEKVSAVIKKKNTKTTVSAKIIIGADGSNSTVSRIFHGDKPLEEDRILAVRGYFKNIKGPEDRCDLYFTKDSFPGYYWLFPTGKGNANVGVGMVLKTMPKNETHLKDLLTDLIGKDPGLSQRIGSGELSGRISGWPLSTYNPEKNIISDRLILIGDAAGLINSLNGEGIQYALLSGRWAAETVLESIQQDDFSFSSLGSYETMINNHLSYDLALSNIIIQFIRNRNLNSFWLELLTILASRARIDNKYAETAGGILAGMLPASKAIRPGFIAKSIAQGSLHYGIKTSEGLLKGPAHWKAVFNNFEHSFRSLNNDFKSNSEEYNNWFSGILKNGYQISGHILNDLKTGILKSKNNKDHG
ncbi:NAD(P)/FAD-dependent oxidoreductase [Mangrovivirga cuniculi]|uniref:NAD(P)/FAD-dependent oxidoreductase n=1 Tax=Mangrovivirga cuniculi TaxID=2715131 RepID=A0A4D7JM99_9BACT|nr:geranylgeranyl reductase family protein [Mangrovivirga cuniculi]QCK15777.1 NAD(P)/FAD-dependent oxidoreductase [Mangrovivirga cuniculi]